jgi:predicted nucleic acid-binding protein
MANSVFLDTNGWIALQHVRDNYHKQAELAWLELGSRGYEIVLTDWIIAETGNGLARSSIRTEFCDAVERFLASSKAQVVPVDSDLLAKAIDLYRRHADKSWGLVDCASFVVMQDRGITEAFTSDQHFAQAGFACLLSL